MLTYFKISFLFSLKIVFVVATLTLLVSCDLKPDVESEYGLVLNDHVLAGKIWNVRKQHFINKQQLADEIVKSNYILLGETHDNVLHHKYQAWVIDKLGTSKPSALVAFEMIDQSQGELVVGRKFESTNTLIDGLDQEKTNWNYKRNYKPVFDSVLKAGFGIYPASLDRSTILAIARKGEVEIPSQIKSYLEKNAYTPAQEDALREEIKMSHCGMENPQMATAMMLIQRVKDAVMMDSLLRKASADTRILVAGSGHVRNDRGVPLYIRRENNKANILTIAWLEVADEYNGVKAYAKHWGGEQLPFDYVWFTARADRPDPCEGFKRHMELKKVKANSN